MDQGIFKRLKERIGSYQYNSYKPNIIYLTGYKFDMNIRSVYII